MQISKTQRRIHQKTDPHFLSVCVCIYCSVVPDSSGPPGRQTPLSMEFSKQEYWCDLPFPSAGNGDSLLRDVLTQRWNLSLLCCTQILYHLSIFLVLTN